MNKSKLSIDGPSLKLALASQSPRRSELLTEAGYEFTVLQCKVSEIFDETLNPTEVPKYLAELKARTALEQHKSLNTPGNLILAADTVVVLGGQVIGKPKDNSDATRILRRLNGKTHQVITGLTLIETGSTKVWSASTSTEIVFRLLTAGEIDAYVATGEPMDKAGAYAIQGGGREFVTSIGGSWSNVVGLPLETLEKALNDNGWTVDRRTPTPRS